VEKSFFATRKVAPIVIPQLSRSKSWTTPKNKSEKGIEFVVDTGLTDSPMIDSPMKDLLVTHTCKLNPKPVRAVKRISSENGGL
jgi:hypothetical protein